MLDPALEFNGENFTVGAERHSRHFHALRGSEFGKTTQERSGEVHRPIPGLQLEMPEKQSKLRPRPRRRATAGRQGMAPGPVQPGKARRPPSSSRPAPPAPSEKRGINAICPPTLFCFGGAGATAVPASPALARHGWTCCQRPPGPAARRGPHRQVAYRPSRPGRREVSIFCVSPSCPGTT